MPVGQSEDDAHPNHSSIGEFWHAAGAVQANCSEDGSSTQHNAGGEVAALDVAADEILGATHDPPRHTRLMSLNPGASNWRLAHWVPFVLAWQEPPLHAGGQPGAHWWRQHTPNEQKLGPTMVRGLEAEQASPIAKGTHFCWFASHFGVLAEQVACVCHAPPLQYCSAAPTHW